MTIRELFREFVVAKRRWEDERVRDISLAYHGVRIYIKSLTKDGGYRLPPLSTFLALPKRTQSLSDMEKTLRTLSLQTGFKLREMPPGSVKLKPWPSVQ